MTASFVAAGTLASGADVASLTPALPVGVQEGDTIFVLSLSSNAVAITKDAAYTSIKTVSQSGCGMSLSYKAYAAGDSAPTDTFATGATATKVSRCFAFRGLDNDSLLDQTGTTSAAVTAQNIGPITGITPAKAKTLILVAGMRRNNPTSIATLSGDSLTWDEAAEMASSAGTVSISGALGYAIDAGTTTVSAKTFTVTGGSTANWAGFMVNLRAEPRPTKFKATGTYTSKLVKFKATGDFGQIERRYASTGAVSILDTDLGNNANPATKWGELVAEDASRYSIVSTGGDTRADAAGVAQGNTSFMRLSVQDGDNPGGFGERCDLGYRSWKNPLGFHVFEQGDRKQTHFSVRLPSDFPMGADVFQLVMQYKQMAPSVATHISPSMSLNARDGAWKLIHFGQSPPLWELDATPLNTWWRFTIDTFFSQSTDGWVEITANDGTTDHESGRINFATLDTNVGEVIYPPEGTVAIHDGDPIPATLFLDIYHDSSYAGTHIDFDNVQVTEYDTVWSPV